MIRSLGARLPIVSSNPYRSAPGSPSTHTRSSPRAHALACRLRSGPVMPTSRFTPSRSGSSSSPGETPNTIARLASSSIVTLRSPRSTSDAVARDHPCRMCPIRSASCSCERSRKARRLRTFADTTWEGEPRLRVRGPARPAWASVAPPASLRLSSREYRRTSRYWIEAQGARLKPATSLDGATLRRILNQRCAG